MNKEEILKKSRSENKNQDIYGKEIQRDGGSAGAFTATILASIFFVIQILSGGGMNYGLYAIVFSITATSSAIRAFRMKRRSDILIAIVYVMLVLILSAVHIFNVISTSSI